MINLLKNKRGSQKLIILFVSAILLIAISIGAFFYTSNVVKNTESNPLQDEQNIQNNENNQNEENLDETQNTENIENTNESNKVENVGNNANANVNLNGNTNYNNTAANKNQNIANNNQENVVYEDTYFQEFVEEKIVNKAWEKLDVSWEPVAFVGALLPADTTTKKPVIEMKKEVSVNGSVTVGDEITYTITAKNVGNDIAKNLVITDKIDTKFIDVIEISNDGIYENDVITWNIEKIDVNDEAVVTFTAKVKEISDEEVINSNEIKFANTANITGENIKDGNSNTVENEYVKSIISGVKKSFVTRENEEVEAEFVKNGETIKYQIILENEGTLKENIIVEDTLPDSLENITIISLDENVKVENGKITWNVEVPQRTENGASKVILEYTARVKEDATGTVKNTVVLSDGTKVEPTVDPIIDFAKISIIMDENGNVLDKTSVTTGDVIEYVVKVENTSNEVDASNITVTDTIPQGTKFIEGSITEGGIIENDNITWNIEKIENGSYVEVSFKVKVLKNDLKTEDGKNTVISNTAYVAEDETNTDEIEYVRENFDVEKTANKSVVKVGEDITYTIKVTNTGTGAGTDTITDIIPVENVNLIQDSIVVTKGETSFATPNLNWTLTLDKDKSATLTYTVKVNSGTKIENTVVTEDSSDNTTTPVVEITKSGNATVRPDGVIEYTITVKNTSDVDVENAQISDILDSNVSYNNDANPNIDVSYDNETRILKWENQTIKANSTNTYTFSVTTSNNVLLGTVIKNKAYINDTVSNTVETTVEEARINAIKEVNKQVVKAGDILSYTITVKNDGNISDTATIVDTLSDSIEYVENTLKVDGKVVNFATCEQNIITVKDLQVKANEEILITFDVCVLENTQEAIVNKAVITTDGKDTPTDSTVTNVITKTVTDENGINIENLDVHFNQVLVYNIKISNKENTQKREFEVYDNIPAGLEYVEGSATDNGIFEKENSKLSWNVTLNPNEEKVISFKVKVLDILDDLDTITNTAVVNNVNTNTVENRYVKPILSQSKEAIVNNNNEDTATNAIKVGDKITYVISVTNSGNYKAENVKVEDTLPVGTKLVSGSLNNTIDSIEAGKTETVSFTVEVITKDVEIKNVAKVNGENTNEVVNPNLVISKKSDIELQSKILSDNEVTTGTVLKYTIKVENTTSIDAKNVVITDTIPQGTTLKEDLTHKISDDGIFSEDNNEITWILNVEANSTKEVSFYVTVTENENGTIITNNAYVNGDITSTEDKYIKAIISGNKESFVTRNGKLVEAVSIVEGDVVTYKITLTNNGSLEKAVVVEDILPVDKLEDITITTEGLDAKVENGKIIWNVEVPAKIGDTLGSVTLEYTAKVKVGATGTIKNEVVMSDGTTVEPTKDPIIVATKSSSVENKGDVDTVTTDDIIVYTIKVTNTSKDVEAKNITVTDTIPQGTKLVEGSITAGGIIENNNITWDIEKIEKDSFVQVSFKVKVLKNDLKTEDGKNTVISNTAYVENTPTNSDELEYTRVNFDVEKTANKSVVKVGEDITYTIKVTNTGTGAGTDTITDIIPVENVNLIQDSIVVTKGETSFVTPNLNWTLTLDKEKSATLTYTVKVNSGTKIENTVVTEDGSDKTTTPVIEVTKQANTSVKLDGTVEYTITVKNTSDVDATSIEVSDKLQEGLVYNNDATPNKDASYDEVTRTLKWKNQIVKANSTNTYTFSVTLDKTVIKIGDEIKNTALVNDTSSNETVTKVEDYVITSSKAVDKTAAKLGDTLTYTITLSNSGNTFGYANVEDTLSEYVTYDNISGITVINGGTEYNATYKDGKVSVENVKVEAGKNAQIIFKVIVNNDVEVIKNKAKVTVDEDEEETNETVTMIISKTVCDLSGNDISSQNVKLNDTLVYKITVNNTANKEAKNVVIKDVVPQGTTFVSATPNASLNKDNELVWNVEVPANDTLTVTFNVKVNDLVNNTKITNIATVDENSTNQVENTYVEAIISATKSSNAATKTDGKVVRGTNITYTINVTNAGSLAKDVTITDLIPEGTTFVSADDSKLPVDVEVEFGDGTTATRKMLTWTVTVPANGSVSKNFVVKVDENTTISTISNTATVDGIDTNTTEDTVYFADRTVRFSKKTDTIIGKNIVMVLDVSHSMNGKALPAEVNYDSPCSWQYGNECSIGYYYDHYYDSKTQKYYHYKTRLEVAKEVMNAFLEDIYSNSANNSLTVDIVTFAGSVKRTITVNKTNYETTINSISTDSSTNIEAALIGARTVIKNYKNGNNNMVIFIGDGDPNRGQTSATVLGNYADTIYNTQPEDTTIYSIGIGITSTSNAANILNKIASSGAAELSTNTDELIAAFNNAVVKESYLHCNKTSENGMITNYAPISGGTAINIVDGTKDIIVKYGNGESDYYTFSATESKTSIEVLNSQASQDMLATKGISVIYDNSTKRFTVDLRSCTINSTLPNPTIQIIYY